MVDEDQQRDLEGSRKDRVSRKDRDRRSGETNQEVSVPVLADNGQSCGLVVKVAQAEREPLAENHCRCSLWTEFHSLMGVRLDQVGLVYECVWEEQLKEWLSV